MRHDHPVPRPDPASTPLSDRLATVLMVWTGSLTVLVLAAVRDLPPVLVGLLLPYFALVAWHLLARRRTATDEAPTSPRGSGGRPPHTHEPGGRRLPANRRVGRAGRGVGLPRAESSCDGESGIATGQCRAGPWAKAGGSVSSSRVGPRPVGPGRTRQVHPGRSPPIRLPIDPPNLRRGTRPNPPLPKSGGPPRRCPRKRPASRRREIRPAIRAIAAGVEDGEAAATDLGLDRS